MADNATPDSGKHRACKCGARTVEDHVNAMLAGYKVHVWTGPKPKHGR